MPSSKKTPHLGLSQFEPQNKFVTADYNRDMNTIDEEAERVRTQLEEKADVDEVIEYIPYITWDNSNFNGTYISQSGYCVKSQKSARMFFDLQISTLGTVKSEEEFLHISGFPFLFSKVKNIDYSGSMFIDGRYSGCVFISDPDSTGLYTKPYGGMGVYRYRNYVAAATNGIRFFGFVEVKL